MAKNSNLHAAKVAKNDEFYTMLTDIEKEMSHYKDFFRGKVVYCNCDDARESNFFKYFSKNFEFLGLKKLITTGYKAEGKGVVLVYEGDKNGNRKVEDEEITIKELEGSGDFRSEECIEFLKEADVVVTNPPFSLFREYVKQLMDYGKKFIIVGPMNAVTYKEIFPYIKNNQLWLGQNARGGSRKGNSLSFVGYDGTEKQVSSWWFANVENDRHNTPLDLYKKYSNEYPHYENYNAIEVSKSCNIPLDYNGAMGVPISFLMFHCPEQFEIIGIAQGSEEMAGECYLGIVPTIKYDGGKARAYVDGKPVYCRIFIRKRTA